MATAKQRGVFVDQITKLGLPESIRQGYMDPVIDGLVTDNPETPAELLFRIEKVEQASDEHTRGIDANTKSISNTNTAVLDLQTVISRQEQGLAIQQAETLRLTDLTIESIRAHAVYEQEILDRKASDVAINARINVQDLATTALQAKDVEQDNRLAELEGLITGAEPGGLTELKEAVDLKADLVDGKVPLSQLPELPTGRKVTVAGQTERLALPVHTDITIAYQTSDALVYILGANADPSVPANWQRLGNTAASGVVSFNGRSGVVMPAAGDYSTDMFIETPDKRFVSQTQTANWDSKIGQATFVAEVANIRNEAAANYVRKDTPDFIRITSKGVAGGVPSLGADGIVPASQLPPLGITTAQAQRLAAVESSARLANEKGDSAAVNILAVDQKFESYRGEANGRLATLEANRLTDRGLINTATDKNNAQDIRLTALEAAASQAGIPVAEKGANNGVAPLGADGKVAAQYLPAVAITKRVYNDVKASRTLATWVPNGNATNEMQVYLVSTASVSATRQFAVNLRQVGTSNVFTLKSDMVAAGFDHTTSIDFTVPVGWEYQVANTGGTTLATIETWYELV